VTDHNTFHPQEASDSCKAAVGGRYLLYDEKLQLRQIHVTYRCKTKEGVAFPICKKAAFPKTIKKLENGETLKLHFFGDSITTGCSASGFFKYAPFMPIWPLLVRDELQRRYPNAKIEYTNTAVGGKCSRWATETSEENLKKYAADLVIIAFGMNDGPKSPDRYGIYNRQLILDAKEANPDCEILEISTTLPNKAFKRFYGNQAIFVSVLKNLCANYDSVELADMTEIHASMLQRKRFEDLSGNHINHPNDFLSRVYAQAVLQTLVGID
jgi:lysophospholipase L1-like esterase